MCYNVIRKIGDFMKLTHVINNKVFSTHRNLKNKCKEKGKKYEFFLDNIINSIYITDRLIFIRESDEYSFKLEISDISSCELFLKQENKSFNIGVINAHYNISNDKIEFCYKLETDEDQHQIILEIGD